MNLPGTGSPEKQLSLSFKPKAKAKVPYVMPGWLQDYLVMREKCIELAEQGYNNLEIKQQLGL